MAHYQLFTLLSLVVNLYFCQEEFHCRPKPGCQIAQCDPSPMGWSSQHFKLGELLENSKFPITCTSIGKICNQDSGEKYSKELDALKAEITELRNTNKVQKRELDNLKKDVSVTTEENTKMKTSLDDVQSKNRIQDKQLKNLFSAMRTSSFPKNPNRVTATRPSTTSTRKCGLDEFQYKDNCYWAEIHPNIDVNFVQARSICNNRRSTPAHPVDKTHFDIIVKTMTSKIPRNADMLGLWTGLYQKPSTGVVTIFQSGKKAPYIKWGPNDPDRGSVDTNVVVEVYSGSDRSWNGMFDASPSRLFHGVICQYKLL